MDHPFREEAKIPYFYLTGISQDFLFISSYTSLKMVELVEGIIQKSD